jgi:hypothetical protein
MNRAAFVLAAMLTAFVMVVTGGIVARLAPAAAPAVVQSGGPAALEPVQPASQAEAALPPQAAEPAAAIDAITAARLGLSAAAGARLLRWPELVIFQGVRAYEVVLDQGAVYIDAASGAVLYNGTATGTARGHEDENVDRKHEQAEHHAGEAEHNDD